MAVCVKSFKESMTKVMITGFQAHAVASGKIIYITIERRLGLARIFLVLLHNC
ncbi:hypothetical protein CAL7102_04029 [Dulcicalothrix desertica PCC 7102]|nr:hypothetical protein CAL7102_04029 [Dulcicalothrix desertica PCC 7102]